MTRRRVLIVDNEATIREMLALILDAEGYDVEQAIDGGEALTAIARRRPDLILLDMKMPGVDGYEFAHRYEQSALPQAPILVITAAQSAEKAASDIHACGFLGKPFGMDELIERVSACIAGSAATTA